VFAVVRRARRDLATQKHNEHGGPRRTLREYPYSQEYGAIICFMQIIGTVPISTLFLTKGRKIN